MLYKCIPNYCFHKSHPCRTSTTYKSIRQLSEMLYNQYSMHVFCLENTSYSDNTEKEEVLIINVLKFQNTLFHTVLA